MTRNRAILASTLAAILLAGCSAPGGGGSSSTRSVLDLTWGWGWNAVGGTGPYADQTPAMRERHLAYYRERIRTEDRNGTPLAPVEQVQFLPGAESNAPTGQAVEPASFVDVEGRPVRLEDYRGKRNLVLVFTRGFPGYLCPLCTSYTAQIAHRYRDIAAAGGEVLLVFPGSPEKVGEFVKAARAILEESGPGALPFPVLLDVDLKRVDAFGIRGDLARPSTFIVDREGKVRYAFVGDQPHERPDLDTLLAELKRLEPAK
ncbi:MAG: peroxiredoxin family protein [Planctomycetaceae bacterium]|nr:peroxiredoxin family protein [Planctomycetota bacterium]NUN53105.1 peroxiredoxin family protein [Planctomycetaceae bacterium]